MDEFREEPSKYIWRWSAWSWVCVGVAVLIVVMGLTGGGTMTPWIIGALVFAVVGGVAFGFVPRASLSHKPQPMTPGAKRKAEAKGSNVRRA